MISDDKTTVSVVMAIYNGERFLQEQLESIQGNLRETDELIVVDDCSSDRSLQIVNALHWPKLVVLRNAVNVGVRASFERGLRQASGDVIFLSDQDDVWAAGKRDAFVATFRADPRCAVVISDAQVVDAHGAVVYPSFMRTRGGFRADFISNFVRNRFLGCSMAVNRSVLRAALPIPSFVPMHDMWLGMLGGVVGTVRFLERPYLMYRRHGGNVSPPSRRGWGQVMVWRLELLLAMAVGLARPAVWRERLRDRNTGVASN